MMAGCASTAAAYLAGVLPDTDDGSAFLRWFYELLGEYLILSPLWTLSFADALWPPGKQRGGADEILTPLEHSTALKLHRLELIEIAEMAIDQGGIRELPQVLGRLKFGRMGGQEEQMNVLRHRQAVAGMPASSVEYEHDLLVRPRASRLGQRLQLDGAVGGGDAGGQMPDGAARGGQHKGDEGAPLGACLDRGDGSLAWEGPDALQEGLEADAVLVDGPALDLGARQRFSDVADERAEPFLNASCSAGFHISQFGLTCREDFG
jgi:hypothetical protein